MSIEGYIAVGILAALTLLKGVAISATNKRIDALQAYVFWLRGQLLQDEEDDE